MFKGDRLLELLKRNKLLQADLAKRLEVTNGTVWKWVRGVVVPDHVHLGEIAKILNTSTDYLLEVTDNPLPSSFEYEKDEDFQELFAGYHKMKQLSNRDLEDIRRVLQAAYKIAEERLKREDQ